MKKKLISLIMCAVFLMLIPLNASAEKIQTVKPGTEGTYSWSSSAEDYYLYLNITESGYYDVAVKDHYGKGSLDVFFESENYAGSIWRDGKTGSFTYMNLYLAKGSYNIVMFYYDPVSHENIDAKIGLLITKNSYKEENVSSAEKSIEVSAEPNCFFKFTSGAAGDYILHFNVNLSFGFEVYKNDEYRTPVYNYYLYDDYGSDFRISLQKNQSYIFCISRTGENTATVPVKVKITKAAKDISAIEIAEQNNVYLPDSLSDFAPEDMTFKVTFSDKTSAKLSYYDLMSGGGLFDLLIRYKGKYDEATDNMLTGKQPVEISFMYPFFFYENTPKGKDTASYIQITPFCEFVSELTPAAGNDQCLISYSNGISATYYWRIKPTETAYYTLHSYLTFEDVFYSWDFTIYDENNRLVSSNDNKGWRLEKGKEYCLSASYTYEDCCTSDVTFWLQPEADFPFILGDIDKDGSVTSADARLALRASVGLEKYTDGSEAFTAADVDHDGEITSADARLILRASVGLQKL